MKAIDLFTSTLKHFLHMHENHKLRPLRDYSLVNFDQIALLLIVIIGSFLRLNELGSRSIWVDEAGRAGIAKLPIYEIWDAVIGISLSPPLGDYILSIWSHMVGFGEFELRFLSALSGIICIILSYYVVRSFGSNLLALLIATIVSVSPIHILYSQEFGGPYAMWTMTIWLSLWSYIHVAHSKKPKNKDIAIYLVAISIASWLHYYTALIILIIILDRLRLNRTVNLNLIKDHFLMAHAWLIIVWVPLIALMKEQFSIASSTQTGTVIAFLQPSIIVGPLKSWTIYYNFPRLSLILAGILVILIVLGIIGKSQKKSPIFLMFGTSLGMLILGYLLGTISHQFNHRYFLPGSLGAYVLAALGGDQILSRLIGDWNKYRDLFIVACIIITLFTGLILYQQQAHIPTGEEDWRSPSNIIDTNWTQESLIVFPVTENQIMFEYYLTPKYNKSYFGLPYTFSWIKGYDWKAEKASQNRFNELQELAQSAPEIWIVVRREGDEINFPLVMRLLENSGYHLDVVWTLNDRNKLIHGINPSYNSSVN